MSSIEKLKPLGHYAMENPPTIYDEEALTALELASRTAAKLNETIALLLKECKEQNLTIDEAYNHLKKNLDTTAHDLLYAMAENGELSILEQKNYEAIKSHITTTINVKEYGAKGDGETDDTEAIREAINSGMDIYFPAGSYLVTETLTIPSYRHIHGEGPNQTTISYQGSGYLFDVKTVYNGRAIIERMTLTGTAENKCIKCSRGSAWGGSMVISDFNIYNFDLECFRFESTFGSVVENGVIYSRGPVVYTTFDGTATEQNFCNCNTVRNVYMGAFSTNPTPVLFKLFNCRDLTFDRCALEKATVAILGEKQTQNIVLRGCWFELLDNIYDFDSTSQAPFAYDCRYVHITNYNANHTGLDYIPGNSVVYDRNGTNSAITNVQGEGITLQSFGCINPTDGFSDWLNIYSLTTQGMTCNVPMNAKKFTANNTNTLNVSLTNIMRYSSVGAIFKVKAFCKFAGGDYKLYSFDILKHGTLYMQDVEPRLIKSAVWEGSVGKTSVETFETTSGGSLNVTSTGVMTECTVFLETNVLPV